MQNKHDTTSKQLLTAPVLGQREIETLQLFWRGEHAQLSAADILSRFKEQAEGKDYSLSINTIQSTMERLWRKNLLNRYKDGKAYIYSCAYSKQEVVSSLIHEISDALGADSDNAIVSGILLFLDSRASGVARHELPSATLSLIDT